MDGALVIIDDDGRYVEANPRALDILGVTLEELRAASPATFSTERPDREAEAAFRAAWEAAGRPDVTGETTVARPDGTRLRVRFAITPRADGRYAAAFEPVDGRPDEAAQLRTVGDVLAAWRAAERRLESLEPDSSEWMEAQDEVAWLRQRHATVFREHQLTGDMGHGQPQPPARDA